MPVNLRNEWCRWCQIAASLPGRTDNEIKNYWNSCIKKKLRKHSLSSSSTDANGNADTESKMPSKFNSTCNTNSVAAYLPYGQDADTALHSAEPLDVMLEVYQQFLHNNVNQVTTAENQHSWVPDSLELKQEQAQEDQNREFPIDGHPTNNQQIPYSQQWIDSTFTHTGHVNFSHAFTSPSLQTQGHTHKTAKISTYDQLIDSWTTLPPSATTTIPPLVEICDSGKNENDGYIVNEDDINVDYSSLTAYSSGITAWSANSPSYTTDFTDVYLGVLDTHTVAIDNLEDYTSQLHNKAAHQSCPPLNSRSQFFYGN